MGELDRAVASLNDQPPTLPLDLDMTFNVLSFVGASPSRRPRRRSVKLRPVAPDCSQALFMVAEFHAAFDLPAAHEPTTSIPADLRQLRVDLLVEEVREFADASAAKDIVGIADALADILYVTYGAALTYGIDLDAVVREVHRSNMSKLDEHGRPIRREDGKVLKSALYSKPHVVTVLKGQLPLPL